MIRVLVVEDDRVDQQAIQRQLAGIKGAEFSVAFANSIEQACDCVRKETPDCIILDLNLPDASGLDSLRALRAFCDSSPIVVLSGADGMEDSLEAIRAGAQDYLVKGRVDAFFLEHTIRYAIERCGLQRKLEEMSMRDEVTGLYNRRGLNEVGQQLVKVHVRSNRPLTLVFLDLDRFKEINDRFGHASGDEALRLFATALRSSFRNSDILARVGGDEFAVMAVECREEETEAVLARLKKNLLKLGRKSNPPQGIAFSSGTACLEGGEPVSLEELLKQADRKMYREKNQSRA